MKRRPWILIILALIHIVAPFFNLVFDAIWAEMPLFRYLELFFQPHNFANYWFHFLAPIVAGAMIYICRRWSFFVYITIMAALGFVSYASFITRTDLHSPLPLVLAYVLNFAVVVYFFLPAVRSVYFDPRLRWWETMPRYQTEIECQFSHGATNVQNFQGMVGNFSQTGLFIRSESLPEDHAITRIEFSFDGLECRFQGQVIHHGRISTAGFGVRFMHSPESKKSARLLADRLQLRGLLQPGRNLGSEDTFQWWLRQLIKTGQGFIPSTPRTTTSKTKPKN